VCDIKKSINPAKKDLKKYIKIKILKKIKYIKINYIKYKIY